MGRGIPREVLDMLAAVPLFSNCTRTELRAIASLGTDVSMADGTVLTEQGKLGSEFFLLVAGHARCLIDGDPVAKFNAGDFFGEMALLDRGVRRATVIADGSADLLVLSAAEFDRLLDSSPSITKKILMEIASREQANASIHT